MNKPIQLRLFCSEESFRSQFAARLLTFYGTATKQESSLSEDDVIDKLESGQHTEMPLKFIVGEFEFEIVWKNEIEVEKGKARENNTTLFLLLLELKQKISQSMLQALQEYQIQKNCFFVIVDKLSDSTKDTDVQLYENDILEVLNSNLSVLVNETHILTVLPDLSENSKLLICDKFKEVARSIFEVSHIKVESQSNEDRLEETLRKMCSQYGIEKVKEFIQEVKNGDFALGCSKVKDRKARKTLMEALQSLSLLKEFILQKQKSTSQTKSEIENSVNKSIPIQQSKLTKVENQQSYKLTPYHPQHQNQIQKSNLAKQSQNQLKNQLEKISNKESQQNQIQNEIAKNELAKLTKQSQDLIKLLGQLEFPQSSEQQQQQTDGKYVGQYQNGKRHGKGTFYFPQGMIYEGQWKYGQPEGKGTYSTPQGTIYEGQWKNGNNEGKGILTFPGGAKNQGQFKNGLRHGKGICTSENGDKYIGYYKEGKREGKGQQIQADGSISYEGQWKNDYKDGKGTIYHKNKSKYQGYLKNGKFDGKGTLSHTNGVKIEGQWKNGQRHGKIIQTYSNGQKYEGQYINDQKQGKGIYFLIMEVNIKDNGKMELNMVKVFKLILMVKKLKVFGNKEKGKHVIFFEQKKIILKFIYFFNLNYSKIKRILFLLKIHSKNYPIKTSLKISLKKKRSKKIKKHQKNKNSS